MPNQDPSNQNQNNQDPNQDQTAGINPSVSFSPQADLPPFPSEFQNVTAESVVPTPNPAIPNLETSEPAATDGSAAPPVPDISSIISSPKKKFGTGKIIATILSILIIVGGVGAGTYLVGQKQIFKQKASSCLGTCGGQGIGTVSCSSYTEYVTCHCYNNLAYPTWGDKRSCDEGEHCKIGVCIPNESNTDVSTGPTVVGGDSTTCDNCTLGTTKSCSVSGKSGKQTCVQSEYCIGKINAGNWGGCVISSTNTTINDNTGNTVVNNDTTTVTNSGWPPNGAACSNGTIGGCVTYFCPNGCSGGCGVNDEGVTWTFYGSCSEAQSALGNSCGQVDTVNQNNVYCVPTNTAYKDSIIQCSSNCTHSGGGDDTTTETTPPAAPYCAAVKAYNSNWGLLTSTELSKLTSDSVVNFCVTGTTTSGTFDKAKFTINAVEMPETTTKRPNSGDFCQTYTIPTGTTTVSVSAKIHHSTLGWF